MFVLKNLKVIVLNNCLKTALKFPGLLSQLLKNVRKNFNWLRMIKLKDRLKMFVLKNLNCLKVFVLRNFNRLKFFRVKICI